MGTYLNKKYPILIKYMCTCSYIMYMGSNFPFAISDIEIPSSISAYCKHCDSSALPV